MTSDPANPDLAAQLQTLADQVLLILQQFATPPGEYELLKALKQAECPGFTELAFKEPMALFRSHFLLYHLLYQLQTQLWQQQSGDLEISALRIQVHPYTPASPGLTEADPLRSYYLEWSNLSKMTGEQLDELLGQFWQKVYAADDKHDALATLGLTEPVDYETVRQRYRQLAMQHHPDRGGDTQTLQTINAAMTVLTKFYST